MARVENPYPLELLTEEQFPVYKEWKRLFDLAYNPPLFSGNAGTIVMPTGDWFDRVPTAVGLFRHRYSFQLLQNPQLVVTGKHSHPELAGGGAGAERVVHDIKEQYFLPRSLSDRIIAEANSVNTKQQAENVYDLLMKQRIKEPLIAVVSTYHLPRLYSTFVSTLLAHEETPKIKLYSVQVNLPWREEVPMEDRGQRWEQVFSEMTRIHNYRPSGDVASEDQLAYYVDWLRNQNG